MRTVAANPWRRRRAAWWAWPKHRWPEIEQEVEGERLANPIPHRTRGTVWREMSALDLRDADPRVIVEARLVCDEMAGRARRNVEVIVRRLTEQGYRFHTNDDERTPVTPFFPASPRAEPVLAWLEEHFGAAPLTLSSWMRVVGDVWLVGKHPLWDGASEAGPARRRDGRGALPRGAHDRLLRERLRGVAVRRRRG